MKFLFTIKKLISEKSSYIWFCIIGSLSILSIVMSEERLKAAKDIVLSFLVFLIIVSFSILFSMILNSFHRKIFKVWFYFLELVWKICGIVSIVVVFIVFFGSTISISAVVSYFLYTMVFYITWRFCSLCIDGIEPKNNCISGSDMSFASVVSSDNEQSAFLQTQKKMLFNSFIFILIMLPGLVFFIYSIINNKYQFQAAVSLGICMVVNMVWTIIRILRYYTNRKGRN